MLLALHVVHTFILFHFIFHKKKKAGTKPASCKIIMPPFSCIRRHMLYMLLRIPGNVLCDGCCIHCHMLRKCLRIYYKCLLLCRCLSSSTVRLRSILRHIPCLTECTLPSFLHLLPVCMMMHNDYILQRISNTLLCKFCTCDTLS